MNSKERKQFGQRLNSAIRAIGPYIKKIKVADKQEFECLSRACKLLEQNRVLNRRKLLAQVAKQHEQVKEEQKKKQQEKKKTNEQFRRLG